MILSLGIFLKTHILPKEHNFMELTSTHSCLLMRVGQVSHFKGYN